MVDILVIIAVICMPISAVLTITTLATMFRRENFKPVLLVTVSFAAVAAGSILLARAISPADATDGAKKEAAPVVSEVKQEAPVPVVEAPKSEEKSAQVETVEEVKQEAAPVAEEVKEEVKKKDDGLSEGNQFKDLDVYEFDVFSGVGRDKLGRRAYINSEIADIKGINVKHLKELYDVKIKGKEYMWFNIKLADGNALTFVGGTDVIISYGPVDKEGAIVDAQIGTFTFTGNEEKPYEYEKN